MDESEIKLRVPEAAAARETLARIGATIRLPRHFEDNLLFDDARGTLRAAGRIVRLRRRDPGEALVTYKGPKKVVEGIRTREEVESSIGDATALEAILAGLGLRPTFRYQKYRESWAWRDAEIVVDETPIGTYLEIEGPLATIHAAARALGFDQDDYITESYIGLFLASGRTGDMVFPGR
jgi:adenylate cyclase, class 2